MERSERTNSSMVDARGGVVRKPGAARRGLVQRAVLLAAGYGIAHLMGLREWTSALLEGSKCSTLDRIGCSVYLFLYGSVIWVAPTLAIAALLLTIWDLRRARTSR